MKTAELTKKYDKVLGEIRDKVKHINCGGCGIYALELGKVLKKHKMKYSYVMLFRHIDEEQKQELNEHIVNHNVREFGASSWTHVVVKVGRKYFDGENVLTKLTQDYMVLNEDFLTNMVRAKGLWNWYFDRTQTTIIKRILNKNLVVKK